EGRSLRQIIDAEGALPLDRAGRLLAQLAEALDFAHAHDVLHRDLKPSNVLVGPDDHVTLVDFGLAHAVEYGEEGRLTDSDLKPGTPEYMAPERIEGISEGPSIDHYALGVMAYELLTGRVPFAREKSLQVLYAQVHRPPD